MKINSFSKLLITLDKYSERIPVLSSGTNAVNIVLKIFIDCTRTFLNTKLLKAINENRYFRHLQNKEYKRCFMLLVPVLGNIVIAILDFSQRKYNTKESLLETIKKEGGEALQKAPKALQDNEAVVLAAVNNNGLAYKHASKRVKNIKKVASAAGKENAAALKDMDLDMLDCEEVVANAAMSKTNACAALEFGALRFRDHDLIALYSLRSHDGRSFELITERLKNDEKFMIQAIRVCYKIYHKASPKIKELPSIQKLYKEYVQPREFLHSKFSHFAFGKGLPFLEDFPAKNKNQLGKAITELSELYKENQECFNTNAELSNFAKSILEGDHSARAVLGFSSDEKITSSKLKSQFHSLALKSHPDKNYGNEPLAAAVLLCVISAKETLQKSF